MFFSRDITDENIHVNHMRTHLFLAGPLQTDTDRYLNLYDRNEEQNAIVRNLTESLLNGYELDGNIKLRVFRNPLEEENT